MFSMVTSTASSRNLAILLESTGLIERDNMRLATAEPKCHRRDRHRQLETPRTGTAWIDKENTTPFFDVQVCIPNHRPNNPNIRGTLSEIAPGWEKRQRLGR